MPLTSKKRYLITTSDEQTWRFDCPVLFLGEWCCAYKRKEKWQNIDFVVAKPYGLESLKKKDEDFSKILKIEEIFFPELCNLLNQVHGKKFSKRFWNLVVGHWLRSFLMELYKDINTIKKCLEEHEISGTTIYDFKKYDITPKNFLNL